MNLDLSLNIDLHCHSHYSDGVLTPSALAQRAHANGVQVWSLTDHDELAGQKEGRDAAQALGMQFITGVEISVSWANQTVHILGLNVDAENQVLNNALDGIQTARTNRALQLAQRFDSLGVTGSYEGALKYAANPKLLSRTHFARFLLEQGVCKSMQEVFDRYLGDGKPAYTRIHWSRLADAVGWIRGAGGRAVIAHPGRYAYTATQSGALFDEFKQLGGEGIEVVTGSHRPDQYREYAEVARYYGFLASRGSDFHAPSESKVDLGMLPSLPSDLLPVWHDWVR